MLPKDKVGRSLTRRDDKGIIELTFQVYTAFSEVLMRLTLDDPVLVYAPEMNGELARWGVYSIPRMWRAPGGELVVRFNGEEDSSDMENMQRAPNLYFTSRDNGQTWVPCENGEALYSISVLTGIDPPYKKLRNGDIVYVKAVSGLPPLKNAVFQKEFFSTNRAEILRTYRFGDIPRECRRVMFGRINHAEGTCEETEAEMDFPEREIYVVSQALSEGAYVKVEEYVQPFIFRLPYFSSLCELNNGHLAAVCCGQDPDVSDRYCGEVYLVVSEDGGRTWKKRSTVARGGDSLPFGYGGDGCEVSLAADANGDLYCAMRMDGSIVEPHPTDTMLCISRDGGHTWSKPRAVADSSVTPHIIALGEVLVLIYGRPGVHIKYSTDHGETWSQSIPIIGKTLSRERAEGRSDYESKYGHPYSYSNTFWEQISDNEILVLYNDLRYPDKNGVPTKAAFVRRIVVTCEQDGEDPGKNG